MWGCAVVREGPKCRTDSNGTELFYWRDTKETKTQRTRNSTRLKEKVTPNLGEKGKTKLGETNRQ